MPLYIFSSAILEMNKWNYQISYEKTQKNGNKYVVSENSCLRNFVNFQGKHPLEIAFLNKVAGYLALTRNVVLGNLWTFQNNFHKKHLQMAASAIS